MVARGYERDFAERCFKQIEGFGEYGFPESHAASFALLVYASCWFKTYYPDVFCAAILNSQPMGFYAPAQLVRDARDHGVEIRDVDVNHSDWDCTLEERAFDPGRIAGAPCRNARRDQDPACRPSRLSPDQGPFRRTAWMHSSRGAAAAIARCAMSGCAPGSMSTRSKSLPQADAFRSLGLDRRDALWAVRALDAGSAAERLPLFEQPEDPPAATTSRQTRLPVMPLGEHVIHDYRSLGLSLKAHPLSFLRQRLERSGVTPNARLPAVRDGRRVTVAGLVLVRQRPGKGNAIFLTLEDEEGVANVIVWQRTFRAVPAGRHGLEAHPRHRQAANRIRRHPYRGGTVEDLTPWLNDLLERRQAGERDGRRPLRGRQAASCPRAATSSSLSKSRSEVVAGADRCVLRGRLGGGNSSLRMRNVDAVSNHT